MPLSRTYIRVEVADALEVKGGSRGKPGETFAPAAASKFIQRGKWRYIV
jgi:hypothetical protein